MDTHLHLEASPAKPGEDSALFVGNATVLLQYSGFTILTDPTFVHRHEKVDLGYGLTTTRLTDPALEIEDLPPLDFVLLSHFHGDHFDQVAQERLDRTLPVVTTPQATSQLHNMGFAQAIGLDTWDTLVLTKGSRRLEVTACPARHGPGISDLVLPDVMGSMLQGDQQASTQTVYISGDTLLYSGLEAIAQRYPDIDLGFFHLGGTKVIGVMVTMDAEQGVEAVHLINPDIVIPIHFDDYDVFTSPLDDFIDAATAAGLAERIHVMNRGDRHLLRRGSATGPRSRRQG